MFLIFILINFIFLLNKKYSRKSILFCIGKMFNNKKRITLEYNFISIEFKLLLFLTNKNKILSYN